MPVLIVDDCRVSSKEQEKEGYSIPAQQKLLAAYADGLGLTVAREFVDVETAKRAGRTGFSQMLAYLRKSEARCRIVLVEKTDRLYRNFKDYVTLDELDLELHLVKENVALSSDSRSSEKFIHGIKVLMAKNYIDNLSEETRKGMLEKAEQGIWPSYAPLGYSNVEDAQGRNVIVPDPELAPMVVVSLSCTPRAAAL
jgi:DNA invertase Pin-like site-specific DNA recombinase